MLRDICKHQYYYGRSQNVQMRKGQRTSIISSSSALALFIALPLSSLLSLSLLSVCTVFLSFFLSLSLSHSVSFLECEFACLCLPLPVRQKLDMLFSLPMHMHVLLAMRTCNQAQRLQELAATILESYTGEDDCSKALRKLHTSTRVCPSCKMVCSSCLWQTQS